MALDYLRVRAYPFTQDVHDFIKNHDRVYVVEQNRDAQMFQLIKLDLAADQVTRLRSVVHYNGLPIDARSVTDAIVFQEAK
jgi:2-oxoglutarate ferredoxin oxidoreductase subunit alpha